VILIRVAATRSRDVGLRQGRRGLASTFQTCIEFTGRAVPGGSLATCALYRPASAAACRVSFCLLTRVALGRRCGQGHVPPGRCLSLHRELCAIEVHWHETSTLLPQGDRLLDEEALYDDGNSSSGWW
jgi:hypothetical protein